MTVPFSAQRILWDDNGTERDLTADLNEYESGTVDFAFASADDKLYIASDLPFNHKWVEVATANANASALSVAIWWNNAWHSAVDLIDGTSASGVSLAQSGIVRWNTARLKGWEPELDSEDVDGVSVVGLYDMYWARLSWSADLHADTDLKYIGHKFCNDEQLATEYPNTRNSSLKTAFASGKTDWNDQHFAAAEDMIQDLQSGNVIISGNQIVDPEYYTEAAKHRAAMIIYAGLEGEGYEEIRANAAKEYKKAINKKRYRVDVNQDGRLERGEKHITTNFMKR